MNLKQWAKSAGVSYATARRWFAAGTLPVPARRVGGLVLVGPEYEPVNTEIPALAAALLSACARAYGAPDAAVRAQEAVEQAATETEPSPEAARMQEALEMYDLGVLMYRTRMRREHPQARKAGIDAMVRAWLTAPPYDDRPHSFSREKRP
jgi:Rv0078B-related antitoxin